MLVAERHVAGLVRRDARARSRTVRRPSDRALSVSVSNATTPSIVRARDPVLEPVERADRLVFRAVDLLLRAASACARAASACGVPSRRAVGALALPQARRLPSLPAAALGCRSRRGGAPTSRGAGRARHQRADRARSAPASMSPNSPTRARQRGEFHRLEERDQLLVVGLVHREIGERHVELDVLVERDELLREPRLARRCRSASARRLSCLISPARLSSVSRSPYSLISCAAVLTPMPGTPGTLSVESPISACTSITFSGGTPNFSITSSRPMLLVLHRCRTASRSRSRAASGPCRTTR